jgi:hypothetical protein
MGRSTITHLVIFQAVGLVVVAIAGSAGANDRGPAGIARMEDRQASKMDIRGDLKCPMPETNDGHSCTLQLVNRSTGETLRVAASNTAMRLYQDGQTRVVATGILRGDALQVISIRAE